MLTMKAYIDTIINIVINESCRKQSLAIQVNYSFLIFRGCFQRMLLKTKTKILKKLIMTMFTDVLQEHPLDTVVKLSSLVLRRKTLKFNT